MADQPMEEFVLDLSKPASTAPPQQVTGVSQATDKMAVEDSGVLDLSVPSRHHTQSAVQASQQIAPEMQQTTQSSQQTVQESQKTVQESQQMVKDLQQTTQESQQTEQASQKTVQESQQTPHDSRQLVQQPQQIVKESQQIVQHSQQKPQESQQTPQESQQTAQESPITEQVAWHKPETVLESQTKQEKQQIVQESERTMPEKQETVQKSQEIATESKEAQQELKSNETANESQKTLQVSIPAVPPSQPQKKSPSKLFAKIQELQEKQKRAEMEAQSKLRQAQDTPIEQPIEESPTQTDKDQPVEKIDTDTNSTKPETAQTNVADTPTEKEIKRDDNESETQAGVNLLHQKESETETNADETAMETETKCEKSQENENETESKDSLSAIRESESIPKSVSASSLESQNESESQEKPFSSYSQSKEDSQPIKRLSLDGAPVPRVTLEDIAHTRFSKPVDSPQNPVIEIDILQHSRPPSSMSITSSENPTIEVNFEDVKDIELVDMNEDSMDGVTVKAKTGSSVAKDEDSNMSHTSATDNKETEEPKAKVKKTASRKRGPDMSLTQHSETGMTAEHLFEYRWPPEGKGDWFMIQEQVSEFLGVKSFKRKYPDLPRRNIDPQERLYLREKGVVTEMQADLGLTIVKADLIHDLLSKDYVHKYKEYVTVLRERKKQQAIQRNKELQAQKNDVNTLANLREKAMKSAMNFNVLLNRERKEERRAYFDVHTFEVQFPYDKRKILPPERTKVGAYPVALIPGQFQNYYKRYSTQELNYLPLNTAVYSSPKKQTDMYADPLPGSDGESEDEVSSESSEAPSLVNSEGESMEIASDMFEDSDQDGNDEKDGEKSGEGEGEDGAQAEPGKTKEEKKEEINRKVQEILDKLQYKESRKGKRGRPPLTEEMKRIRLEQRIKAKEQAKAEALMAAQGIKLQMSEGENSSSAAQSPGPGSGTATPVKGRTPRRAKKSKEVPVCNICSGTEHVNASKMPEVMIQCAECSRYGHPSCLELTNEMIAIIKTYPWQCMECKTCVKCKDAQHEDCMLFCDHCDRGFHTFCVGLQTIPNGRWECPSCVPQGVMLDPLTDTEVMRSPTHNPMSPMANYANAGGQNAPSAAAFVPQPPVNMLASSTPNRPGPPMGNIVATATVVRNEPLANMSTVPPMVVNQQTPVPPPMPGNQPIAPPQPPLPQQQQNYPMAQAMPPNPEGMDMS